MEYIYLADRAGELIYCNRCGRYPFGSDFARREPVENWIARLETHKECTPESPGLGAEE